MPPTTLPFPARSWSGVLQGPSSNGSLPVDPERKRISTSPLVLKPVAQFIFSLWYFGQSVPQSYSTFSCSCNSNAFEFNAIAILLRLVGYLTDLTETWDRHNTKARPSRSR